VIATLVPSAGTTPLGLELSPEGSVFYANAEGRVFRWDDGSPPATTHVAGNTLSCTETTTANPSACGDNGLAVNARLSAPRGLALAPDGSLYIADFGAARVRRVAPDGIITTVAGTGAVCTPPTSACGDGGLAKSALLNQPEDLAIAPDGTLYIGDAGGLRVRRVAPDGVISTVLGTGLNADGADGHGKTTSVQGIGGLALGPDGSLYVACDGADAKIRRLGVDGFVTTVAGGGTAPCTGTTDLCGDGGPATGAKLKFPRDVAVASDGGLLVADLGNHRIRRVSPQGLISTVAGTGAGGYTGDGGAAAAATFRNPSRVDVGPDGRLYVADMNNSVIRRVSAALPAFPIGAIVIPAEDGTELYEFDAAGRHQKTFETLSGGLRRSFAYDAEGLLAEVREWVSATEFNATTVVRNLGGDPDRIAVDAPFGQRTTLDLDPQGFVERLTNPAGEAHRFASTPGGLVTSYRPPEIADNEPGFVYTYEPATGRLTGDEDPLGETKALARSGDETSYAVTVTTPLLRETVYTVERLADGSRLRTTTTPDGLTTETTESLAAARLRTLPDGTEIELRQTASARRDLQFLAPLAGFLQARLPGGGPTFTRLHTQQATYNGAGVLTSQTDTITQNGKATVRAFDPATRVVTTTTPEGRPIVDTLDALGRLERRQVGTLHPVSFTYDTEGRLATIRQGPGGAADRVTTFAHDPVTGFLDSITDPEARVVELSQVDAAGRVTEEILPGGRTVGFSYDDNGNLTSLTPPGKTVHLFRYTPLDQEAEYEPPEAQPGEPRITASGYDADRALDLVTRPDGGLVDPSYEAATGRLDTLAIPGGGGVLDLAYHPTSGYVEAITTSSGESLALGYTGPLLTAQTWSGPVAGTVTQTYSNDLQLGTETAGGATATYLYDDDGLLERIQESGADVMTLTPDPSHGLLTGTSMGSAPNLLTTAIGYSSFGERSSDAATYGPTSLYSNTYPVRDDLGRIVQKVETLQGTTTTFDYTYDPAGRLDTVRANGTLLKDYAHDANGNRTFEREDLGGAPIATYDAQDRLLAYGSKSFTYSEAGELETVTEAGQTTTYGYDALGALRTVTLPNATQIEYVIDGLGRRVGKRVNGVLQQGFLYGDQLRVAAELDGSGAVVSRFVYATRPNVPEYMVKAGQTYRLLTDHLGSVRLVVNVATGAVVQRIDYDAFGVVTADTSPGFQPFGFAGGLYDADTGLTRFGARDYDPSAGRWTAKDPIRFSGRDANLFAYALVDPVNLVDSDGRIIPLVLAAGVLGGLVNAGIKGGQGNENLGTAFVAGFVGTGLGALAAAALGPVAGGSISGLLNEAANQFLGLSCGGASALGEAALFGVLAGAIGGKLGNALADTAASEGEAVTAALMAGLATRAFNAVARAD
jgi:RHS repeat-associated protein